MAPFYTSSDLEGSYASVGDLMSISMPDNVSHDFQTSHMERWLRIASRQADAKVGQRFTVPLKSWSDMWVWAVCEIAFCGLMAKRGYDPEAKTEKTIHDRLATAQAWVDAARDYEITPDPTLVLTEPAPVAQMLSYQQRGWNGPCVPTWQSIQARRGRFF